MAAEVSDEVKNRLGKACYDGDLTTVKSILSEHPDIIHAEFVFGKVFFNIFTLIHSLHQLFLLSIYLSIYLYIPVNNCISLILYVIIILIFRENTSS